MKVFIGIECDHCGYMTQVPLKDTDSMPTAVEYLDSIGWQFDGANVHCPNCSDSYDPERPPGTGYDMTYRPDNDD